MYLVFYRTNDVFEAEEILQGHGITPEITATPVQDKAYCGVCLKIADKDIDSATKSLHQLKYRKVK